MDQTMTQTVDSPSSDGTGDATRPDAARFDWLHASAYMGGWQFGEQGVLEDLFAVIGTTNSYCVEFGAGDGGALPLTCGRLIDAGWDALLIEPVAEHCGHLNDRYGSKVKILNQSVGLGPSDGLDSILKASGAPIAPDLVVIDVDSVDYQIWNAVTEYRPRVVCIEHMDLEYPGPEADAVDAPAVEDCGKRIADTEGFVLQASARAIRALGESKGYVAVFTSRVNTIFVRSEDAEKAARPMVRLNVGAGDRHIPGYVSIDIKTGTDARKLPYADASVDEVYASHLLEHFDYETVPAVLAEWVRVLRPGGLLRVSVPDVEKFCKERNQINSFQWDRILLGGHSDANDRHGSVYDAHKLRQILGMAGIGGVDTFEPFANDCSRLPVSLNMEGRKRHFRKLVNPRLCVVLSQPRFTFTGHEMSLVKMAQRLKFDIEIGKGAFWDRDMTIATQAAISKYNPDILIYTDYDSVATERDLVKLIAVLNSDPTLAAVGVVQMERHGDKPLVFDQSVEYEGDQTDIRFHHFGLTAIRADLFGELPLPWFWSIPGSTGQWTEWDRSDADITFWRLLREHGFRVAQRNDIVIGHIINAIKWPGKERAVIIQPESHYQMFGKPKSAGFNPALYKAKKKEGNT